MKFAGCIIIALHLLALVVSQTMLTSAKSEQNAGFWEANFRNDGCECIHYDCGCCVYIYEDNYFCANMTYLDKSYGLQVTITYGNYTLITKEISARHPPPICVFKVPDVDLIEACLQFYDMDYSEKHISGCLEVELELFKFVPMHVYKIGCFKFPIDPLKEDLEKSEDDLNEVLKLINETLNSFVPSVQMV